jgi:excisionase family DNA binding protein
MDSASRSNALGSDRDKPATSVAAILKSQSGLVNSDEAAAYIGVKPGTLEVWRCTKRQVIPYVKVGRLVKYRRSDLDAWLASHSVDARVSAA